MPLGANKAAIMGVAGVSTADVVLLYDTDHSNASTASITSGINSTYGEYIFKCYNMNPASDNVNFTFNCSIDSGSNYNVTKTSTAFMAYHDEGGSSASITYRTGEDHAQATGFQMLAVGVGNGGDESCAGELHIFNPASTTYVKHFYARFNNYFSGNELYATHMAGYFNDTNDIDAIQFKMSSGNFDGTIKMWGVK